MKGGRRLSMLMRRFAALSLALAVLVTGFVVIAPELASAQERVRRSWSLFEIFTPRKSRRIYLDEEAPRVKPPAKARKARKPSAPPVPVVEKLPDAKTVLVAGDFVGGAMADGLRTVFAENPRVRILDRTNSSSGFVRSDFFNWSEKIKEMTIADKPAAIIVMIGANDRQQMRLGELREAARSEGWTKEYTLRVETFRKAAADSGVPLVWVGLPAFKSPKTTSDMLAFNEIYRTASQGVGSEFVDVWDGFVDENGAFVTTGPDINGQPVRLRANDGINFTSAGKRKLAFYVEKPLNKILGEAGTPATGVLPTTMLLPTISPDAPKAAPVDRTMPVSLDDPELDGGGELLGMQVAPKRDARSAGERLSIEGIAPDAAPGRADDFSWPAKQP